MAATEKTFNTTELLEAILLKLPAKEIFFTTRLVSKQWKEVIDNSICLQKATFLAPDGDPILPTLDADQLEAHGSDEMVPLLRHSISSTQAHDGARVHGCKYAVFRDARKPGTCHTFYWKTPVCNTSTGLAVPFVGRQMYLAQPPIAAAAVFIDLKGSQHCAVAYDNEGIRLGLIADISARLLKQLNDTDKVEFDRIVQSDSFTVYALFVSPFEIG